MHRSCLYRILGVALAVACGLNALRAEQVEQDIERRVLRVGVVFSHYQAPNGEIYSPSPNVLRMVEREMIDPSIKLIPVINPGTEHVEVIAQLLQGRFAGVEPINGHDSQALQTLDVIVGNMFNPPPEMIAAIEQAVENGVGLILRQGTFFATGFTPSVLRLTGLEEGQFGYRAHTDLPATISNKHALLGMLEDRVGDVMTVRPNGPYGVLAENATPLIRLNDVKEIHPVGANVEHDRADYFFYPLYVVQLGEGRIVVCSFQGFKPPPVALDAANGNQFMIAAARWAAKPVAGPAMPDVEK